MSSDAAETLVGWSLQLAEDVDLPGWVYLPSDLSDDDRRVWLSEMTKALLAMFAEAQPDRPLPPEDEVRSLLEEGLKAREVSDAIVLYQVWPVAAVAAVLCRIDGVRAQDLPDFTEMDGRLYAAEARHIGPGLQFSTRRVVELDEGPLEVSAIHLVFVSEDIGVMVSLDESASALITQALVGFGLFKNALSVIRDDGSQLTSIAPATPAADDEWAIEEGTTP